MIEALKDKGHMANRFPGIKGLAHKDYYTRAVKIGYQLNREVFDFVPKQYNFPQDELAFKEAHKSRKRADVVYIAKPVASSEGNSILLFKE